MQRQGASMLRCVSSIVLLFIASTPLSFSQGTASSVCPKQGKISSVQFVSFPPSGGDKFNLAIKGEDLPGNANGVKVIFDTKDPAHPQSVQAVAADGKEVLVEGVARAGTEVTRIRITQGDCIVAESSDFAIAIKDNPPKPAVATFDIKLDHETNKQFPNLHSVLITKEGGEPEIGFANNPHQMSLDLLPLGASDIQIKQSSPEKLDVHFVAAEDYTPTDVAITVYNSSDLDTRHAIAIAKLKKDPPDPDEPKVTGSETVFLSRSHGMGRIRIYGENFGDYDPPPPYLVDDYLWNCLERFRIQGNNEGRAHRYELEDVTERLDACARMLGGTPDSNGTDLVKLLDKSKMNLASFVDLKPAPVGIDWMGWEKRIREKVMVSIRSRNPEIGVEKVEVININDKMIDVYFEFRRYRGLAYPFRLEDSTITITKDVKTQTQTVKNDKVTATVTGLKKKVYAVPYQIAAKRDQNLTYRYKVLDAPTANTLMGRGVSENFYVVQLSVVNTAAKKVSIPLASIQAEIEWVRGSSGKASAEKGAPANEASTSGSSASGSGNEHSKASSNDKITAFAEGPATLPPMPLAAVSAYFDAYQKSKGKRAMFFNVLDAVTVAATALVPFTGPSFKDAEVFFSGGFIPAVHKAMGDLSSQQLQNLTSLSWETSESVPANGGSIEKYIYIPRKNAEQGRESGTKIVSAQIAGIMGLEVTGFEVTDSEAKDATEDKSKPDTTAKKPAASASKKPKGKPVPAPPKSDSSEEDDKD